jgi:hypothetical protein
MDPNRKSLLSSLMSSQCCRFQRDKELLSVFDVALLRTTLASGSH